MKTELYRIRNKEGLYASGGGFVHFTRNGKVWTSLANLKSHLRMLGSRCKSYEGCELIRYTVASESTISGSEFVALISEVRAAAKIKEEERKEKYKILREEWRKL